MFVNSIASTSNRTRSFQRPGPMVYSVCTEAVLEKAAYCNSQRLDIVPNNLHPDIQKLEIRMNVIQKLFNTSFSRYPLLTRLDLSHNLINVIETETFKRLRLLVHLDLSYNHDFHIINDTVFRWASRLLSLDLRYSGLVCFSQNTMKWLPKLRNLSLHQNKLNIIHIRSCPNPNSNTSVDLSDNQISAITSETFSIDCSLNKLYLDGNPVVLVDPNSLSRLGIDLLSLGGTLGA